MSKFKVKKEDEEALNAVGDAVYSALLKENDWTEEQLNEAIRDKRLTIEDIQFHDQEDGTTIMSFKADIKEKK